MKKVMLFLLLIVACSPTPLLYQILNEPAKFSGQSVSLNAIFSFHTISCGNVGTCTYGYYLVKDLEHAKTITNYGTNLDGAIPLARNGIPLVCTDKSLEDGKYENCNHNKIIGYTVQRQRTVLGRIIPIEGIYYFQLSS